MTVYHLGRILVRCALIAVVAAGCFGIYLFKRTNSRAFQEGLDARVGSALGAKEAKIQDFGRSGGEFKIRQLAAEGTAETFYNRLDASLIQFKTGLLGGVTGPWDAGTIRVDQLNVNLKAGADSAAEAEAIGKSFVKSYPDFTFSSLDVKDASLVWGFTAAERQNRGFSTQGRIDNSHLKAVRGNNGWHLEFEGGTFTQNWLEKADIQTLVMDCNADGIRVTEASLKLDQTATITISDLEITAGEKPQVSGRMKISHLDVRHIIPDAVREYMEGSISGEFKISGSTNTAEGIVMEGEVKLDRDVICMRERLPLLKAMSVLDNYHTYRKVEFNDGGFRLKTSAQKINISAVDLKAGDLMMLKGGVVVRQPTPKELAESPAAPAGVGMGTDLGGDSPQEPAGGEKKKADINLKEAGKVTGSKQGFGGGDTVDLFDRHAQERMASQVGQETMARLSRALRYEGSFELSLPHDAFERAERLQETYPADPVTGRIPITIPINGTVGEISVGLSENILEEGSRK